MPHFVLFFLLRTFLLAYINCTKGFHCDTSIHEYNVLWSNSLPPLLFLITPPQFILFFLGSTGFWIQGTMGRCSTTWVTPPAHNSLFWKHSLSPGKGKVPYVRPFWLSVADGFILFLDCCQFHCLSSAFQKFYHYWARSSPSQYKGGFTLFTIYRNTKMYFKKQKKKNYYNLTTKK
jgi:hypothetical protein